LAAGLLELAGSAAHALVGWPAQALALSSHAVPAAVEGPLRAGWIWGSFAMLGFGILVTHQALRALRGGAVARVPVAAVALAYVGFGTWALAARGQPQFLGFVALGLLTAALLACPSRPEA
jgi:hypothetical protein